MTIVWRGNLIERAGTPDSTLFPEPSAAHRSGSAAVQMTCASALTLTEKGADQFAANCRNTREIGTFTTAIFVPTATESNSRMTSRDRMRMQP